jgi:hypothetical protein
VSLKNVTLSAPVGVPRQYTVQSSGLAIAAKGTTVSNVAVIGGAGAGIYVTNSSNFVIDTVYVADTAADGIQITNGSHDGRLNNATVVRTGDDAIAIVSYAAEPMPVHNREINSPTVIGTSNTRGIAIVGGDTIVVRNFYISTTALSGLFVGSQGDPFFTASTNNVWVDGGVITGGNFATGIPTGVITVYNSNPNSTVSNVTIQNVAILNPYSPYFNIAQVSDGGGLSNVVYRNIAIQEDPELPVFYTNAPNTFTVTGLWMNGRAIDPTFVTTT